MRRRWIVCSLASAATLAAPGTLGAQRTELDALATWIAAPAATGRELPATDAIMRAVPGFHRDALGSLVLTKGTGAPHRVVACTLDEFAFFVSEITDDGYLRLHDPIGERPSALWDQFHEGQRVRVQTTRGAVPGVIGVKSTHLQRRRAVDSSLANVEQFYVDVGARSRAEVTSLGIELLDPVSRDWPRWTYASYAAGPYAGERAGCAAVATASRGTPSQGRTTFVIAAQTEIGFDGLRAALQSLGAADSVLLAGVAPPRRAPARPAPWRYLPVTTRFTGTLAESVSEADLRALRAEVERFAGVSNTGVIPSLVGTDVPVRVGGSDALGEPSRLLATFTDVYAVSGHEQPMRDAVMAALPAWAKSKATVDTAGNIVISVGPDHDTAVIVAHMDEIGYEVTKIDGDGSVSLRQRGGFFQSLWEGQTALLHLDRGQPIAGIFVPRETPSGAKQPRDVRAWFGLDSAALAARGVAIGSSVTSYKRATRLAGSRFTARAIDDRTGCAALVLAMRALDPTKLPRKVIYVFSTREEIGLDGARAVANTLGASVRRVYAVDTFVSSDSPLESQRFAYAPLGKGAVVRALDNSSTAPMSEIDRIVSLARTANIPIQVGTTNGGNDGSTFTPFGVVDVPLSWSARYSHSPVETIDLADLDALGRLMAVVAMHPDPSPEK